MEKVAVLDYGSSNLRSVVKALEVVSGGDNKIEVVTEAEQLSSSDRIVFPGQGAIGQCMKRLLDTGFDEALKEAISTKPYLGLCLGLQSLLEQSEEDGGTAGLAVVPGQVKRFPAGTTDKDGNKYKIPHMGWNQVYHKQTHPLWNDIDPGERFYFVHSYYVETKVNGDIAGSTDYILNFTSAVARDNVFAVQFHPEKSQRVGLQLLKNFLHWRP